MPIAPDTKDWTWVIEHPCPECGFDAAGVDRLQIGARLRDNVTGWTAVLSGGGDLRTRPAEDRWSPLEYACHVRDVLRLYDQRLTWMLTEDDPRYPNWDQDATAIEQRYGEQDPAAVLVELQDAGRRLAEHFDSVQGSQWERTGTRSDGARFTVDSFAHYLLHDPVHHLYDVTGIRA